VEARSRGREAKTSEGKRQERIGPRPPGNTGPWRTDSSGAEILGAHQERSESFGGTIDRRRGHEGQGRVKARTGYR